MSNYVILYEDAIKLLELYRELLYYVRVSRPDKHYPRLHDVIREIDVIEKGLRGES